MGEIKSAFELALEKAERLSKPSQEELIKWKGIPVGERLAALYLKGECELLPELSKYEDDIKVFIAKGAQDVLVRNIDLPRSDATKRNNKRAMEAVKVFKNNKVSVEDVLSKMRRIFSHYEEQGAEQRRQAYEALKSDFRLRLQQAVQPQLGLSPGIEVNVESQPQFQEEWRRLLGQLDSQYYKLLDEYKQQLERIP
jgi:hypothetical protein